MVIAINAVHLAPPAPLVMTASPIRRRDFMTTGAGECALNILDKADVNSPSGRYDFSISLLHCSLQFKHNFSIGSPASATAPALSDGCSLEDLDWEAILKQVSHFSLLPRLGLSPDHPRQKRVHFSIAF